MTMRSGSTSCVDNESNSKLLKMSHTVCMMELMGTVGTMMMEKKKKKKLMLVWMKRG